MAAKNPLIQKCLDGLSIGDGFGQRFFYPWVIEQTVNRTLPADPWEYTDDTEMAIAIIQTLEEFGEINQDDLAKRFADRFIADSGRGYGPGAQQLLRSIARGEYWNAKSLDLFNGQGSYGNGGAMRAAPVGVWFAGDDTEDRIIEQARLSAEVTHAHIEGQVGAIAIALAATWAVRWNQGRISGEPSTLIPWVKSRLPDSAVRSGIEQVESFDLDAWAFDVANAVGNGDDVTAQDTVPFCLWMIAANLTDFEEAMWTTARVGGDSDTNCAIVGGVVAVSTDEPLPAEWIRRRERLRW